jgi:coenzyme Q-binding protein COQ10
LPVKKIIKKFNYSKKDLIELVLKIDDYKFFLPWCINSKILTINKKKKDLKITADLEIGFKFFNYGFEKILNSFERRAKETIKF